MNANYTNRMANLCKETSAFMDKIAACDKEKERMRQYVIAALEELKDTVVTVKEVAKKEGIAEFRNGDFLITMKKSSVGIDNMSNNGSWLANDLINSYQFTEEYIDKVIANIKVLETSVDYWDRNFMCATQIREWIVGMYKAVCVTLEKSVSECKGMLESAIKHGSKEYEKVIQ